MSYTETIQLQPIAASSKAHSTSTLRLSTLPSIQNVSTTVGVLEGGGTSPPIASGSVVTPQTKRKEIIALGTLYWCSFILGWNDGTLGPLLPRVQSYYQVEYIIVSLLFICASVGAISGSLFNALMADRFGFGKILAAAGLFQIVGYSIIAPAPPFPVMCLAMGIIGFSGAQIAAQANTLVASIRGNASAKMGFLHGAYGAGALVVPLVSTQFAQQEHWSFHYLTSLGLATVSATLFVLVFKGKPGDVVLAEIGSPQDHIVNGGSATAPSSTEPNPNPSAGGRGNSGKFGQMMKLRTVHLLAVFILIYVGVEVTLGSWIVTFIIQERHGGPSSGYISTGFFGGLTAGRILLIWVNRKIGEKRVVYIYTSLCIALELTIWFVPSLIGNAVAVSLVGMLLGPFYPICMRQCSRVLPRKLLSSSISWIAGFGQVGSATIPFMTGALAGKFSISALQPLLIAMMVLMGLLWFMVPSSDTKDD